MDKCQGKLCILVINNGQYLNSFEFLCRALKSNGNSCKGRYYYEVCTGAKAVLTPRILGDVTRLVSYVAGVALGALECQQNPCHT